MSKCIFFCIPAIGHLNPQIALASALVKKGEHVIFYATPAHEEKIKRSGADVRVVDTDLDRLIENDVNKLGYDIFSIARITMEYTAELLDETLEQVDIEKPDYIVHDLMTINGRVAARLNKIPAVCTIPTFVFREKKIPRTPFVAALYTSYRALPHIGEAIRTFKQIYYISKKYGIPKKDLFFVYNDYGDLDLITTSRYFQFDSKVFSEDKYKFIGPVLFEERQKPDPEIEKLKGEKVIYISLGSVYNNKPGFYNKCVEAFRDTGYKVVMSCRDKTCLSGGVPDNFIVRDFVPQLQVLKYAGAFITHAGMNSVQEGFYNNVPLICVPQAVDQILNARRAVQLGAAIYMPRPDVKKLREAVDKIFSVSKYGENAAKIGKTLREAGGVEKAVELIEEFKKERGIS